MSQVALPDDIWAMGRTPDVLHALASGLGHFAGLLQAVSPEGLHGAAIRCETWTVPDPAPGSAERSEVQAAAMRHEIHLLPARVEARSMWAVDRAGTVYGALQRRGVDAEPRTQVSYRKPGSPRITGDIPAALERIVTALLGVTMPGMMS